VLLASAAGLLAPAARVTAVPACGQRTTWYSDASKTVAVGWRNVASMACGCYVTQLGQTTAYSTTSAYAGCAQEP
jgi:hypothetical protein